MKINKHKNMANSIKQKHEKKCDLVHDTTGNTSLQIWTI